MADKDDYKFPDEIDDKKVKAEDEKFEVEIEDDTPPEDQIGRALV